MTSLRPVSVNSTAPPSRNSEMVGLDLLPVDQRDGETVGQPRAKFFHQVEGERRAIGTVGMEKADERVEADAGQRGDAIVPHQRVEK